MPRRVTHGEWVFEEDDNNELPFFFQVEGPVDPYIVCPKSVNQQIDEAAQLLCALHEIRRSLIGLEQVNNG